MNKETEIKCKELIHKYFLYKTDGRKTKARNNLFILMKDDMQIWTKSILRKWGKYDDNCEVLSQSWDCFYFALTSYDLNR